MSYFRFRLLETSGRITGGIIKLPYEEVHSATSHLERDGGSTIFVKKVGRLATFLMNLATFRPRKKIPRAFQAEFFHVVAMMLRSGMVLTTALEEAATSSGHPEFEKQIREIIQSIQGGVSLSEAAQKYKNIFPPTVLHLVRIGEETGRLDALLEDASEHITRINNIVSDTKQALMYPSFVFLAIGAAMVFWFYYVVPKIMGLFTEMDVELPGLTLALLQVSEFVQAYFLHLIVGAAAIVFLIGFGRRASKDFKRVTDALLLRIPIIGTIVTTSTLAFITEYFNILLNAGLDILQSMNILEEAIRNLIYSEKLGEVRENIRLGNSVADSFKAAIIFPHFVVRMINSGELSGTLPEQLAYIAENYRRTLTNLVASIGKMIEPIVLVVAGVIFAVIIGGLMLPIYDLVSRVSG